MKYFNSSTTPTLDSDEIKSYLLRKERKKAYQLINENKTVEIPLSCADILALKTKALPL